MHLKNKIINYFVIPSGKSNIPPKVILSDVTMNHDVAKSIMTKELREKYKDILPSGPILHVCYDFDSQMVYSPNAHLFSKETFDYLMQAAEVVITKSFGYFSSHPVIKGSPFGSLRIRSIDSFRNAKSTISKHYNGKVFNSIPIIEAYLPRMPTTLKQLPSIFSNEGHMGGYVGPSSAQSITFIEEKDMHGKTKKEPVVLLSQKTPFILINISSSEKHKSPSLYDKEGVVLDGYREYFYDKSVSNEDKNIVGSIDEFADLYTIKRLLYEGWPIDMISGHLLSAVNDFSGLINGLDRIMMAIESFKSEGRKDPCYFPYYLTFKIDSSFPIKISSIFGENGKIDTTEQNNNFLIIDFDVNNSYVIIETPLFIPPQICANILKAKSSPFIANYNPIVNKIDVKTDPSSLNLLNQERIQVAKIKGIIGSGVDEKNVGSLDFRTGNIAMGRNYFDPNVYMQRKVSDYYYACDFIIKMCKEANLPFVDFDVVVGPIGNKFGEGVRGGFMDEKLFAQNKITIPFEIDKGVIISPPIILINSTIEPNYSNHSDTIVHEYQHYLYGLLNPNYKIDYQSNAKNKGYEYWHDYFNNPSEVAAHKNQIRFELSAGKSYDEIIRDKVSGTITLENYPIAMKFAEMVKEVVKEMEEEGEENEQPT